MKSLQTMLLFIALSLVSAQSWADCENLDVEVYCKNNRTTHTDSIGMCWDWGKFSCQICHSITGWHQTFYDQCNGSTDVCVKITHGDFISDLVSTFDKNCSTGTL